MKILMSAFACCPGRGSEEGVGWNWAVEAAKLGHDVVVMTQACHRAEIEKAIAQGGAASRVTFDFVMPQWLARFRKATLGVGLRGVSDLLTHMLWQFSAYNHARKNYRDAEFDFVHHITYGGIRHPTLLGFLPFPLILGPLGGGDRVPFGLRRRFGWVSWLRELTRDIHTWLLRFDPITLHACSRADAIYVKSAQSKHVLPQRFQRKTAVHVEIGTHDITSPAPERTHEKDGLNLLYVGRFLDIKGMQLGLMALAKARQRGVDARLTIVGPGGNDEANWRETAERLGVSEAINWTGFVSTKRLHELYQESDALLFPSLRDSSGNVVLESFARGLPVICLDLGGPAELVDGNCGRVIGVEPADEEACANGLAAAIEELAASPSLQGKLARGALQRASHFMWPHVVSTLYADARRRLELSKSTGAVAIRGIAALLCMYLLEVPLEITLPEHH